MCSHPKDHNVYKKSRVERDAYRNAKRRCDDSTDPDYHNYGGRGIEFRFLSFDEFLECLGERPSRNHSLDRKDNDGHYEPGNVQWALKIQQVRNMRRSIFLTIDGSTLHLYEWVKESGVHHDNVRYRLRQGWCHKCSVFNKKGVVCGHLGKVKEKEFSFQTSSERRRTVCQ